MLPISEAQCGGLLVIWLEKHSTPENVKQIAKGTGYNDAPFFGAQKAKIKIISAVTIFNTAIAIIAVNQTLPKEHINGVIDSFLAGAKGQVFNWIESKDPSFKKTYSNQIADYFEATKSKQPIFGLSYSFLENIGLKPLEHLEAQLFLNARISTMLSEHSEMLQKFIFVKQDVTAPEQFLALSKSGNLTNL